MFKTIFLLLFIIAVIKKAALTVLNYRHMKKNKGNVPKEIEEAVDVQKLKKIDAYNSDKMRFSIITLIVNSFLTGIFIFSPLFPAYTDFVSGISGNFIANGIIFFLLLSFIFTILELPLSFYSTFVIEARHGFNRYSKAGWAADQLKSLLLSSFLTALILGILFFITGETVSFHIPGIFLLWGVLSALILFFAFIAPVLFIPLFYKLRPLKDTELSESVNKLVKQSGYRIKRLFEADESKKSSHANAAFTGLGKSRTVILFDTLISKFSREEIIAVLAHEIGHGKKGHMKKKTAGGLLLLFIFIVFSAWMLSGNAIYSSFGIKEQLFAAVFLLQIFFFDTISFFFNQIFSGISRKHEYEADEYAVSLTGKPKVFISFLKKIASEELSNIHPHPLYMRFFYSHPPLVSRIKRIREVFDVR
ncbi:MAG: M48 family metallopeptidase [bacterium]